MLNNFIIIAAETGMRPTELFNLDWGHVEGIEEAMSKPIKDQSITVIAFGKGRKPQRFVPKRGSIRGFEGAWKAFRKQFGRDPEAKDPVFCNQHGERMGSYRKSLNALLEAANLRKDAFGNFYSAYSFRHSYATWALQKSPPVDIYTLAINMRTSVEMIEKWYSRPKAALHQ
jgi:integrase